MDTISSRRKAGEVECTGRAACRGAPNARSAAHIVAAVVTDLKGDETIALAKVPAAGTATIFCFDEGMADYERQRLLDLGFTEGTVVRVRRGAALGGLRAYEVRGTLIGLRRTQAEKIRVYRTAAS